jgi:hypothetical protein
MIWCWRGSPAAEDDMKLMVWLTFGIMLAVLPSAISAQWVKRTSKGASTDKQTQTFVLRGTFVTAPAKPLHARPSLSISCRAGEFVWATLYGVHFGPDSGVVNASVDDGKSFSWIGGLDGYHGDWLEIVFLYKSELKTILAGHKLLLSTSEYPAGTILMEFEIPDSSEVFAACGKF